jgi:DHA2 family multidrug resistance protein
MNKSNPWIIAIVVSLATFMEVLDTTIVNVALNHIAGSLAATQEESTWVVTSYLVTNAIILPLSGWLANSFGRKRYFLACIAVFTITSFACGAATSLAMIIICRLFQGLSGGGLMPMQQAIVLDAFPLAKRGAAFAVTGITIVVAPIIGPTLGGYITDHFSWRWIFFINIPVGILAYYLVSLLIEDPPHAKAQGFGYIDKIGLVLVAIGLGALQIFLDKGDQEDWFESQFIIFFFTLSLTTLCSAIWWLTRQKEPFLALELFKDKSFSVACLMIFLLGFMLYSSSIALPFLVQTQFGYDAQLAGLVLSPGSVGVIILMPIIGKLITKMPLKYLIIIGLSLLSFGMFFCSILSPQTDFKTFVLMRTLQVLGLPFLFVPVSTLAYSNIPKEMNNKASALFAFFRNIGGSIGISLITTYVSHTSKRHGAYIEENINASNPIYNDYLMETKNRLLASGVNPADTDEMALGLLHQELLHQSSIYAYIDVFQTLSYVALTVLFFSFFIIPNTKVKKSAHVAID